MLFTGSVLVLIGGFIVLFGNDDQLDRGAIITLIGVVMLQFGEIRSRLDELEKQIEAEQEVDQCDS